VRYNRVVAESYEVFARHFDAWQQAFGGPYDDLILPRVLAALARHAPAVRRVADLGIGTGDLVVALAGAGYTVVGVDRSPAMLAIARAKVAAASPARAPELVQQDLLALDLDAPVDAAVCVYTVINQLTGDGDLSRALASVHAALEPGGLFLFELNLPEAYARYWTGAETVTLADAVVTREHRRVAGTPCLEALVTIRDADGAVSHDRIRQRPYDDAEVADALRATGFTRASVERYDPFAAAGVPTKALWAAGRPRVTPSSPARA
jgi:SAM-dependent methyltransferase